MSPTNSQSPPQPQPPPPIIYGELCILGYNGSIPHSSDNSKSNRRTKSKFLLCQRQTPNGIKKSRHYSVKHPQAVKATQDKDIHSISYTFSRSQVIIVEYMQDSDTDMFQIGRSSESPIDFVIADTVSYSSSSSQAHKSSSNKSRHSENFNHSQSADQTHLSNSQYNDLLPSHHNQHNQFPYVKVPNHHQQNLFNYYRNLDFNVPILVDNPNQNCSDYLDLRCAQTAHGLPEHGPNSSSHQNPLTGYNSAAPSAKSNNQNTAQSTISRFACRIIVDRNPPYTARIYAAGFDSSKNIFLGEKATKWEQDNTIDGLTTNGVLLMHPQKGYFCNSNNDIDDSNNNSITKSAWREVSVDGGIYVLRESRSAMKRGMKLDNESNILQDGTLIDLCGATLLWRSLDGFRSSPTRNSLEEKVDMINASRPQCPVGLNTLIISRKPVISNHRRPEFVKEIERNNQQPFVYLKCGHVQGFHDWGMTGTINQRKCPICFSVGMVSRLNIGIEPSFYIDNGDLTHVFNPCGHMASERTVKYWCSVKIPHGTHFFHSICPFCALPLATGESSSTKLIFQDYVD